MPRFVILEHDHPFLHWDLMLECGPILRTWRLSAPLAAGSEITATATFDHRLIYLDYEGPISGGRGCVNRHAFGTFTWQEDISDRVVIHLEGEQLRGALRLEQIAGERWRGEFRVDAVPP